jgi:hypothetical protein
MLLVRTQKTSLPPMFCKPREAICRQQLEQAAPMFKTISCMLAGANPVQVRQAWCSSKSPACELLPGKNMLALLLPWVRRSSTRPACVHWRAYDCYCCRAATRSSKACHLSPGTSGAALQWTVADCPVREPEYLSFEHL